MIYTRPQFALYCPDFVWENKDLFGQFYDFANDEELSTRQWVYSVTNSTAPTVVDNSKGGIATFTNTTADNDRIEAQNVAEIFKMDALGQQTLFLARGKLSHVGQVDYNLGIAIQDTDNLGDTAIFSDGFVFHLEDEKSSWDGVTAFNAASLANYSRQTGMKAADATLFHRYAILIETDAVTQGKGQVRWYIDGSCVGIYRTDTGICYDEELALTFGVQNGEGSSAKSLQLDCIGAFQVRP